jgi:hypothetical protein
MQIPIYNNIHAPASNTPRADKARRVFFFSWLASEATAGRLWFEHAFVVAYVYSTGPSLCLGRVMHCVSQGPGCWGPFSVDRLGPAPDGAFGSSTEQLPVL